MRESYKKIVNEDLSPCLPKISAEVLYVFGEKDAETPLYMAKKLTEGTKGSALVVMARLRALLFYRRSRAVQRGRAGIFQIKLSLAEGDICLRLKASRNTQSYP